MRQEIRLASFNVRNLALPGIIYYENTPAYSPAEYDMKTTWIASVLDQSNADVIGLQEIFSPESVPHILTKTKLYQNAHYIIFESENLPTTPNVALISRLPIIGTPIFHSILPDNLKTILPEDNTIVTHFSRPILQTTVAFPNHLHAQILIVHLKSKRPDYPENSSQVTPFIHEIGAFRALIKRGMDALGLRHLLIHLRQTKKMPLIVMGDFNDFSFSTPIQIITGLPQTISENTDSLLYNAYEIQPAISHEEKNSPFLRKNHSPRIDHILVSEEFTSASRFKCGKLTNVQYLDAHLAVDRKEFSDHALIYATIQLT